MGRLSYFLAVVILFSIVALGLSAGREVSRAGCVGFVSIDAVANASGSGNGLCCRRAAVLCYGGAMDSGNCVGVLPWKCTCVNTNATCWAVTDIKRSDVCVAGNPTDTCATTPIEGCWLQTAGTCQGGVGPWSWGGALLDMRMLDGARRRLERAVRQLWLVNRLRLQSSVT